MSSLAIPTSTFSPVQYLSGKQAAAFCGYSYDRFRHLAADYQIPRYGPFQNRFCKSDLNTWMQSPNCFKIKVSNKPNKLKALEV